MFALENRAETCLGEGERGHTRQSKQSKGSDTVGKMALLKGEMKVESPAAEEPTISVQ